MNLENLGVQEMNAKEMKQVDGGLLGILLACSVAYFIGREIGKLLFP